MEKILLLIELLITIVKNTILGINLKALQLITRPKNFVDYINECLLIHRAVLKYDLQEKPIIEFFPECKNVDVTLNLQRDPSNWLFWDFPTYTKDLLILCTICKVLKPKKIFEIGTFKGYSSYLFALNTNKSTEIYSLDIPKKTKSKLRTTISDKLHTEKSSFLFKKYNTKTEGNLTFYYNLPERVHYLSGDSADFDFSNFYNDIDLFFIDGAHSYEYAKNDSEIALKCCHKGSVIIWHDYGRWGVNGVTKWLNKMSKATKLFKEPGCSLVYTVID